MSAWPDKVEGRGSECERIEDKSRDNVDSVVQGRLEGLVAELHMRFEARRYSRCFVEAVRWSLFVVELKDPYRFRTIIFPSAERRFEGIL
jgi:hypothetical protein